MKSLQLTTEFGGALVVRKLELGSSALELSLQWGERDGSTVWMTLEEAAILISAIGDVLGITSATNGYGEHFLRVAKEQGKIKEV
jgi:hypothetical protein